MVMSNRRYMTTALVVAAVLRAGSCSPQPWHRRPQAGVSRPGGHDLSRAIYREVSRQWNGDVLCTDDLVNLDANTMYNFLLYQTRIPPNIVCHIVGTHYETSVEEQLVEETTYTTSSGPEKPLSQDDQSQPEGETPPSSPVNDSLSEGPSVFFQPGPDGTPSLVLPEEGETRVRRTQRKELISKTRKVTAFDLSIDLTQYLLPKPVLWTVSDAKLEYRGRLLKERWTGRENASSEHEDIEGDQSLLKSSKALQTWVKDFIDHPGPFKEFEWTKRVEGWDWESLREAIKGTILRSCYTGDVAVAFNGSGSKLIIRPPGVCATMNFDPFGNFLLWLSLVKPYLLCFYEEGRWAIGGEVWNFRRGGDGTKERVWFRMWNFGRDDEGMKEGEWFRMWESTIGKAVEKRMIIKDVLKRPWVESPGAGLESYPGA